MSDDGTDPTRLPIFGGDDLPAAPTATRRPGAHRLAGSITSASAPEPGNTLHSGGVNSWINAAQTVPVAQLQPTISRQPADSDGDTFRIDYQQVRKFRERASERLSASLVGQEGIDPGAERELGRSIIKEVVDEEIAEFISDGRTARSEEERRALVEAVFDALFGLGRLQKLVDDPTNENVIIAGHQRVFVEKTDGQLFRTDPVADSDEELIDLLSFVASRSRVNARSFSPANPRLHLRLDDGSRLAAAAWVTARPSVVIRRHRLREVTLSDMVELKMISKLQASFLEAAVKARKSIVVAGPQGAGKTTLVRALCSAIPPHEAIGTFETEYELHLHELEDQHPIVHPWEERAGSGEIGPDGRAAGAFSLAEALYDSFRFNLSRQIVGEVRGREVWSMIKAMESGAGSISTTHAANADAAMRKLVTCAMEDGAHVTQDLATMKLAETIDLVVQVHLETTPIGDDKWRRSRWVSEILHITPGEAAKGYATTPIFRPAVGGGPAVPGTMQDELRELERYGFDLVGYLSELSMSEVAR
jgi:pilus assembly protein CpaF